MIDSGNFRGPIPRLLFLVVVCSQPFLAFAAYIDDAEYATGESPTSQSTEILLPRPAVIAGSCATNECHPQILSLPFKHGPVRKDQCAPCHVPVDMKHEFEPRQNAQIICRDCHLPVPPGKARHDGADDNCFLCHDPHGGEDRFYLKPASGAGICVECHGSIAQQTPHHPFMDKNGCIACHEIHHAEDQPLLRSSREKLCLACHGEIKEALAQKNGSVHEPVSQDCSLCHRVHGGGQGPALTASEAPTLCQTCHADLVSKALNAKVPHKPVIENQRCAECHEPHASSGRHLLKGRTRDLCLGCHDRTYELSDGSVLENVKAQLDESAYLHGPARQGSCTPCHDPHGSDFARLLKYDFPCSFYAPYEESRYDLCFRCHDRTMVQQPQSETTRFRNGKRNLHYLHVHQEKGRTCRACHHEHACDNPLRIRSSVPFGKWTMPLTYKKTDDGGSCASSCHAEYGYDRTSPVRNPLLAADRISSQK